MRNHPIKFVFTCLFILSLAVMAGCGGGRKLAKSPKTLAFVPFAAGNITAGAQELNEKLINGLEHSGSFRLQFLQKKPALLSLSDLEARTDTSSAFVLTGKFLREIERVRPGKRIPGLAYLPKIEIEVSAEVRLYNSQEGRWVYLDNITAVADRRGDAQVLEYDAEDPSLAINARERQVLRETAYSKLFEKIVKVLEKAMEIEK